MNEHETRSQGSFEMSEKAPVKGWYSKNVHYSGHYSKRFWRRVNAIKDPTLHHEIYFLGCELQNMEGRVLRKLKEAERP